MNYKYKKYSLSHFINTVDGKINKTKYSDIINTLLEYINEMSYSKDYTFNKYYENKIIKLLNFYKKYDENTKVFLHFLIDNDSNKSIAYCVSFVFNDNIIRRRYNGLLSYINTNSKINYIKNLIIHPDYRGKGLCNYFINRIKKNSIKNNINYMLCDIDIANTPRSVKCFIKNGFIQTPVKNFNDNFFYINLKKNI